MIKLSHITLEEYKDLYLLRLVFEAPNLAIRGEAPAKTYGAQLKIHKKIGLQELAYILHRFALLFEMKFPISSSDPKDADFITTQDW